jgi:predicted metal-dependent phosphoesterase TrpH
VIDLHCHSDFSDGSESPAHVVELAASAGCSTLALTDHDVLDGLRDARARADDLGVRLVDGCEVSCVIGRGTMHVLCYFIPPTGGPLQDELSRLRDDRGRRNVEMADRLAALGLPITLDEVTEEANGRGVGRPHFAAVLVRAGVVGSIQEAFDRFLAKGRPGYVGKSRVDISEIVALAHASGGVAALAHPLSLELDRAELERAARGYAEQGLVGIECYYARYDQETRRELVALARRCGLVPTGGSDFHGSYKPDISVGSGTGDLSVPDEVLDELVSRRTA